MAAYSVAVFHHEVAHMAIAFHLSRPSQVSVRAYKRTFLRCGSECRSLRFPCMPHAVGTRKTQPGTTISEAYKSGFEFGLERRFGASASTEKVCLRYPTVHALHRALARLTFLRHGQEPLWMEATVSFRTSSTSAMTTADKRQASPPNAPSLGVHIVKQTAGFLLFFLLLLPVVLFRATLHIFPRTRPHPSWSLRRSLAIAVGRLYLTCTTYLSLPRDPGAKSWKADDRVHKFAGKGTKVKTVLAPSLGDEWIVGVAREGKGYVCTEPVPCFWTFVPSDVWREGNEVAAPGEKVVMYVNGGYV